MTEYAEFHEYGPMVVIVAPAISSYESMEYFCQRHEDLFKRRRRFGTINDMNRMRGMLDARTRKLIADWTKSHEIDIGRWVVASANVVDNALIRGIITAVHWIAKPPNPLLVTGSHLEGVDYVVDHLQREGIPLGAELEAYRHALRGGRPVAQALGR